MFLCLDRMFLQFRSDWTAVWQFDVGVCMAKQSNQSRVFRKGETVIPTDNDAQDLFTKYLRCHDTGTQTQTGQFRLFTGIEWIEGICAINRRRRSSTFCFETTAQVLNQMGRGSVWIVIGMPSDPLASLTYDVSSTCFGVNRFVDIVPTLCPFLCLESKLEMCRLILLISFIWVRKWTLSWVLHMSIHSCTFSTFHIRSPPFPLIIAGSNMRNVSAAELSLWELPAEDWDCDEWELTCSAMVWLTGKGCEKGWMAGGTNVH